MPATRLDDSAQALEWNHGTASAVPPTRSAQPDASERFEAHWRVTWKAIVVNGPVESKGRRGKPDDAVSDSKASEIRL
jgi:hypothetical protein